MKRRHFIQCTGLALAGGIQGFALSGFAQQRVRPKELSADLIIVGGGTGGCAAALAAVRNGLRVILTEETDWIGGQLTQQAVHPDEHPWIEIFGATRSYRESRSLIRDYYHLNYPLTPQAGSRRALNPGNGSVSKLATSRAWL
jgi:NADPH-dependent 2,4-dienoyl-CoA reductase/sulfur reductase-like enzyme